MSDVALVETLELPFQWDDGQFISPFVRSNESTLTSLAVWILENHIWPAVTHHLTKYRTHTLVNCTIRPEHPATLPLPSLYSLPVRQSEQYKSNCENDLQSHRLPLPNDKHEVYGKMRCTPPFTVHFSILDVGCGDGQALLTLTKYLITNFTLKLHETHLTELVTLELRVTGVDLDDQLIQVACSNARAFANEMSDVQLCFMCADARTLPPTSQLFDHTEQIMQTNHADNETSQNTQVKNNASTNECTDYATIITIPTLMFLYLLPEALELLQDYILHCLLHKDEKCLIASNTWPISYLHPWHLTSLNDTIHLYQDINSM